MFTKYRENLQKCIITRLLDHQKYINNRLKFVQFYTKYIFVSLAALVSFFEYVSLFFILKLIKGDSFKNAEKLFKKNFQK